MQNDEACTDGTPCKLRLERFNAKRVNLDLHARQPDPERLGFFCWKKYVGTPPSDGKRIAHPALVEAFKGATDEQTVLLTPAAWTALAVPTPTRTEEYGSKSYVVPDAANPNVYFTPLPSGKFTADRAHLKYWLRHYRDAEATVFRRDA